MGSEKPGLARTRSEQCFTALCHPNPQWVLEGDIKSCFDKISHEWLLAHVPTDKAILNKWLKSGYMEEQVLSETEDGCGAVCQTCG